MPQWTSTLSTTPNKWRDPRPCPTSAKVNNCSIRRSDLLVMRATGLRTINNRFFKRLKLGEKWRPRTCSSSQVTWVVTQSAAKSVAFIFHIYLTLKLIRSLQNEPLFNRAETRSCEKKVFPGVILCQTTELCFLMDTDWSVKLTAS